MTDSERYHRAAHAMQSGVAIQISAGVSDETEPKHLRVGVNSALSDVGAIAGLLIAKGVFTLEEYTKAVADKMEQEEESYRNKIAKRMGITPDRINLV